MGAGIAIINADRALSLFASSAGFPTVGKEGPLYFARDTGKIYRWDFGTAAYVEIGGGVTDHGLLAGLADDDHPQYALDADLANHEAAVDPHPQYALDTDVVDKMTLGKVVAYVSGLVLP